MHTDGDGEQVLKIFMRLRELMADMRLARSQHLAFLKYRTFSWALQRIGIFSISQQAAADSRPDSGTGSRLFEINIWMWRYSGGSFFSTAERFHGRPLSLTRWQCERSEFRNPDDGRLPPWSVGERRP